MARNILTGIKATGAPHLGNYLGAIRPAIELSKQMQDDNCFYFIADYHGLSTIRDPKEFKYYVHEIAAVWMALGLDPEKCAFYRQADIPEVFELSWILAAHTPKGDMNRAHAYKAAVDANEHDNKKDPDYGVNMGLFTYPILMAADILLFDSNIVPVGKDQVQHVEMARAMASRINQQYGKNTLVEPQELYNVETGLIKGLDGRKMSKSYGNSIPLFCTEKKLKKLINKITTDSTPPEAPKDPEGNHIMDLYKLFATPEQMSNLEARYRTGISWGEAKAELFNVINNEILPARERYNELMDNPEQIDKALKIGAKKARVKAQEVMSRVRRNITGF